MLHEFNRDELKVGMQGGSVGALDSSDDLPCSSARAGTARVIHAVGRLTDSVFRFVGPATEALSHSGRQQVVIALEDPFHPHLLDRFHHRVEVIALPWGSNPVRRWQRWLQAFRHVSAQGPIETVHLHGFIPSALVAPLFSRGQGTQLVYSPHGSRSHKRATIIQFTANLVSRPWLRFVPQRSVVSMPSEAKVLSGWSGPEVNLVEVPVNDAYLHVEPQAAHHPLVVGGVHDDIRRSAAHFTQLAVILGNGDHGLAFNWIGPVDSASQQCLTAAEVGIFNTRSDEERAHRLAAGWVFLSPAVTHGFPGHIAEAMACGLPVVTVDCPIHRDLIDDGKTGFLCKSDEEMVMRVAELAANPDLRRRIGGAGREMASSRFTEVRFKRELLDTYPAPLH